MKRVLSVFVLMALLGCEQQTLNEEIISPDCVEKVKPGVLCTLKYDPVCGCNMKTYGNACSAESVGIRVLYAGECKK